MNGRAPRFAEFWAGSTWAPIPDCPGRYKLVSAEGTASLATLVGAAVDIEAYCLPDIRDVVFVARVADGGMSPYRRTDGTWLHTLNTKAGFERKLAQLRLSTQAPAK